MVPKDKSGNDLPGVVLADLLAKHVGQYGKDFPRAKVVKLSLFTSDEDRRETLAPTPKLFHNLDIQSWFRAYSSFKPLPMAQLLVVGEVKVARMLQADGPHQDHSPARMPMDIELLDVTIDDQSPAAAGHQTGRVILFVRSGEASLTEAYGRSVADVLTRSLTDLPDISVLIRSRTPALFLHEPSFPMVYRFDARPMDGGLVMPPLGRQIDIRGVECDRRNGGPFKCQVLPDTTVNVAAAN